MIRTFMSILAIATLCACSDASNIVLKDSDRCTVGVFKAEMDGVYCLVGAGYYVTAGDSQEREHIVDCFETAPERDAACSYLRMEMCGEEQP